ncbi:MAG: macrolide ABC transporter ATP-binding protein [Acidobacteria bacterium RBG_16_68_9]|nr:MAG: macrolide ABC transporter ATP-binding protein [Acidobacteria bacterium RBG_16_68_9]
MPSVAGPPAVAVENVSKRYSSGAGQVVAVDAVSLRIERGEFAAIAGPSGSGKTTLLNLMGALDRPDGGRVFVDGIDLTDRSRGARADLRLHKIGFVFQAFNLIPVLSALENAEFVLLLQGVGRRQRAERVRDIFRRIGLEGLESRRPRELSGGQQQRVAVARAIVGQPALVLADEPTANLDSHTGAALLDVMQQLNADLGTTFVFSTHDPSVMERASRVIHLRDGKVVGDARRGEAPAPLLPPLQDGA